MQILSMLSTTSVFTTKKGDKNSAEIGKTVLPQGRRQVEMKLIKSIASPFMAAILALSPISFTPPVAAAQSVEIQKGAALFRQACIGCHDGGGNIIQPGATLFEKDMERNGVDNEDEIYRITYFGKGRMPGFGEKCTPRGQCTFGPRLRDEEIRLLAQFVKSQADEGWSNHPTDQD